MDGPNAQYLRPIAGLDAAIWVPPSRGQLFWLRRAPPSSPRPGYRPRPGPLVGDRHGRSGHQRHRAEPGLPVVPEPRLPPHPAGQSGPRCLHARHRDRPARPAVPGPRHASRRPRPGGVVGVLGGQGTRPGVGRLCRRRWPPRCTRSRRRSGSSARPSRRAWRSRGPGCCSPARCRPDRTSWSRCHRGSPARCTGYRRRSTCSAGRPPQPARYRAAPRRPACRAGRLRHR